MSHFAFLESEWPDLIAEAKKAEALAFTDPRTSCFYARRTLELAVTWLYRSDSSLKLPYDDSLSSLIHAPVRVVRTRKRTPLVFVLWRANNPTSTI